MGAWSVLASFVPQGAASEPGIRAWASAFPVVEPLVRVLGLHQAFGAPLFLLCALLLAVSTALCAWQRTKVAVARNRVLRDAGALSVDSLAASHDLEIAFDASLGESEVLSIASRTLDRLALKTKRHGDVVSAVSSGWSVWGSPVFHWALLALIITMPLGTLLRSSGQIGLAVGQSKADKPESYGLLATGALRGLIPIERTIRVDAFELNYKTDGVDRGPTPTVSILDAQGNVVMSQRVYPNNTLKTGSLTIYPAEYGFAATLSMLDAAGVEMGQSVQYVDFSTAAEAGTVSAGHATLSDGAGGPAMKVFVTVPLDRVEGGFAGRLPKDPRATIAVTSAEGAPVLEKEVRPGDELVLPDGRRLRLLDLGYYARLQLVDDPSIPLLYLGLAVAMTGLGIATLTRQQIVAAALIETADGPRLAVRMRLWRNVATSRSEIRSELVQALSAIEEEEAS